MALKRVRVGKTLMKIFVRTHEMKKGIKNKRLLSTNAVPLLSYLFKANHLMKNKN
jgi:hypothetical protein